MSLCLRDKYVKQLKNNFQYVMITAQLHKNNCFDCLYVIFLFCKGIHHLRIEKKRWRAEGDIEGQEWREIQTEFLDEKERAQWDRPDRSNFSFLPGRELRGTGASHQSHPMAVIPAAIYRSASGAWAGKCSPECFLSAFGHLARVPQRVLFECLWCFWAPKVPKSNQKALFGALGARCPKSLKKHSGEHFPARAPWALL